MVKRVGKGLRFGISFVCTFVIIISSMAFAAMDCGSSVSALPQTFFGQATSGGTAQTSAAVVATLGGHTFSATTDSSGNYQVDVARCSNQTATSVTFSVCAQSASQTGTYSPGGEGQRVSLTISSACSTSSSSSSSGGGGGGGGSGGGGGGAGGTGSIQSETIDTGQVDAGGTAVAKVSNAAISVTEVTITVETGVSASSVTVSDRGIDSGVATNAIKAGEDKQVFKYLQITVDKISNANIQKAVVKFKVPKAEGYEPATIELRRFSAVTKTWSSLPTSMTSEDAFHYYFEAETPGFSIFAIVGQKKAAEAAPAEEGPPMPPAVGAEAIPEGVEGGEKKQVSIWIIAAGIAAIFLIGWLIGKKKKDNRPF